MSASSYYDRLFDERIGQNTYQKIVYLFLGFIALSDEAEIISLSVILPAIKTEWGLTENQVSLLGSVLFFGIFLGSIFIGTLADKLGRRTALLIASALQFIIGFASSAVNSFLVFVLMRSLLGFTIGCTIPIAPIFITEISTSSYRGKGQIYIQAFFVIGMFYAIILSKIFLDGLSGGNWRGMLAAGAMPSLIVFLGTLKYIKESPRFLIAKGKVEQGISVLNYISAKNNRESFEPITCEERIELINWHHSLFYQSGENASWVSLLRSEYQKITCLLTMNWFGLSFNFFGMVFILPIILQALQPNEGGINEFFLTMLGEIPAIFFAYFLIDRESFGRKNSTLLSHLLAGGFFILAYFCSTNLLILVMILARVFTKMAFITINPLTSELYPTSFRTIAMGLTSGVGRLGASIMPMITVKIFNVSTFGPFLLFGVVALLMGLAAFLLPFEPLGRQLDHITKDPEEELRGKDECIETVTRE